MNNFHFDYSLQPGRRLEIKKYVEQKPLISLIVPFYNDKLYIRQAVQSFLNQTFPLFELLIIDDGSTDKESLAVLEEVQKMDNRIKIFHKENEGLAATRDFGAKHSADSAKYLAFCDSDDLLAPTFLECAYWTLETNKEASWAYTDVVGFEAKEYLWNSWFDSERLKKSNNLVATSVIRKEAFWDVNGYELREKAINEDWNFWIKMIAKKRFPVRMNFYGNWYRRKEQGELAKSKNNSQRALEIVQNSAKNIKERIMAIQYPQQDYNWEGIAEALPFRVPQYIKQDKITILMIIPWMVTGGADKFNLDLIRGLDKNKFEIIIVTTEPNKNELRQQFEEYATVYDLTTFLNRKYWAIFIQSIIQSRNVDIIFNTNSKFGYAILPYLKAKNPEIPILDYIHMEEWYNRNGGFSRDSSTVSSVIDKTLVCNNNSEKILVQYFKKEPKEVDTVYIGVDPNEFDSSKIDKEKVRRKYKLEDNKYILSYICRIADQKRPYLLLKIIEKLKQERQDFVVLVVGDGIMLKHMKEEAKKRKLNCIQFLGNKKDTKEIYAISDLTINCSLKEGLALTSYESLAMGVPVVSSDVGGQKELINDEVGVIVPCLQKETEIHNFKYSNEEINNYVVAINKILANLDNYKKNCRKRILNAFTIDQMIKRLSNIFEQTVANPNEIKRQHGENLKGCLDITKELINSNLMLYVNEYEWLCKEYNRNYFDEQPTNRRVIWKEYLWANPVWRIFVRTLQKLGIIDMYKKVKKALKKGY